MPRIIPEGIPHFPPERLGYIIRSCQVPKRKWRPGAVVDYGLWWIDRRGRVRIEPHWGQERMLRSRKRFVFVVAGSQSGKTSFAAWLLYYRILRSGPGTYMAVTTTNPLFENAMLPQMRLVFEKVLGVARYWRGARVLEIADPETGEFLGRTADDPSAWARIMLRSVQSEGALEAATAKGIWMDEFGMDEWDVSVWEALRARVTTTEGFIIGTTTPYNKGWVYSLLYQRYLDGDPLIDWVNWPSIANPMFSREEFEHARETMEEWRFRMRYLGEFAEPPSLIYHLPDGFYVPRFPVAGWWPVVVGVDFGGVNTATVALAQEPDTGVWYAFHEWLGGNMTTGEHVKRARQDYGMWWDSLTAVGGAPGEEQWRMDWGAAGLRVQAPPRSSVEERIDAVRTLIQEGRLKVFSDLQGLRHEFATYRRETLPDGTVLERIKDKERFHRLDALGYAALYIVHVLESAVAVGGVV